MTALNTVVLIGRLTRDPELRSTTTGMSVCSIRLAVDRAGQKEGDEIKAGYFDVTVWGKSGENCALYLTKGSQVGVSGALRHREWEASDGTKRSAVEVNANQVQFLTPKGEGDGVARVPTVDQPATADDDIPF